MRHSLTKEQELEMLNSNIPEVIIYFLNNFNLSESQIDKFVESNPLFRWDVLKKQSVSINYVESLLFNYSQHQQMIFRYLVENKYLSLQTFKKYEFFILKKTLKSI